MSYFSTLNKIFGAIYENNLLLPHFQRDFVWKTQAQKKLLLSTLTNLPASSSLLLEKKEDDNYKCIKIGMRSVMIPKVEIGKKAHYPELVSLPNKAST